MGLDKLKFLYKTLVLEHAKQPHHRVTNLPDDYEQVTLHNTTCGDTINLAAKISDGKVSDAVFNGNGCTISQASASMMTDAVHGRTIADVEQMVATFSTMTMGGQVSDEAASQLGDAAVMASVAEFPARIKCATLAWHAIEELINRQ